MATDVSAPLPDLDLGANATITVTVDDPSAVIVSLAVHGWQEDASAQSAPIPEPAVLLAQTPGDPAVAA